MVFFTRLSPKVASATSELAASASITKALPTLVIDLDETILYRTRRRLERVLLYSQLPIVVGNAYQDAVENIKKLKEHYNILAMTARWSYAERGTRTWMEAHGLGDIPLVFSKDIRTEDTLIHEYKYNAIKTMRESYGWNPIIGVGDRPTDLTAYAENNMRAFIVVHPIGTKESTKERIEELLDVEKDFKTRMGKKGVAVPQVLYFSDEKDVHDNSRVYGFNATEEIGTLHVPKRNDDGSVPSIWNQIYTLLESERTAEKLQ